jgi:hypothetical protein
MKIIIANKNENFNWHPSFKDKQNINKTKHKIMFEQKKMHTYNKDAKQKTSNQTNGLWKEGKHNFMFQFSKSITCHP